jgi:hypothetical protein
MEIMMSIHDTVHLDQPRQCQKCGAEINEVRMKEVGSVWEYEVGDVISHVDDYGVRREKLYCPSCNEPGSYVYLVVFNGVLIGCYDELSYAKQELNDVNLELLMFLYRSLYRRYQLHKQGEIELEGFLNELIQYYEDPTGKSPDILYFNHEAIKGAKSPMEAIVRFLITRKKNEKESDEKKE